MNINFKNILFLVIMLFGLNIVVQLGTNILGVKSDYCIEDGDCKEGRVIYVSNSEILINKKSCIENNWKWFKKDKICKIVNTQFKVKKVVYE